MLAAAAFGLLSIINWCSSHRGLCLCRCLRLWRWQTPPAVSCLLLISISPETAASVAECRVLITCWLSRLALMRIMIWWHCPDLAAWTVSCTVRAELTCLALVGLPTQISLASCATYTKILRLNCSWLFCFRLPIAIAQQIWSLWNRLSILCATHSLFRKLLT